jgi:hypothetical protein
MADLARRASPIVQLFDLPIVVGDSDLSRSGRAKQCAAKRQFLSARSIGQKAELSDSDTDRLAPEVWLNAFPRQGR